MHDHTSKNPGPRPPRPGSPPPAHDGQPQGEHADEARYRDLRLQVGAALRARAPQPPSRLISQVHGLAARRPAARQGAGRQPSAASPGPRGRIAWSRSLSYAAALAAVLLLAWWVLPFGGATPAMAADSPISRELAVQLHDTHEFCRRFGSHGSTTGAIDIGPLPTQRHPPHEGHAPHDHSDDHPPEAPSPADTPAAARPTRQPPPDLTAIGYELLGVKACGQPAVDTAHVLYRSTANPRRLLSLFVQPDRGELPLEPGRLYDVTRAGTSPMILVWRGEGRCVFLVSDTPVDGDLAGQIADRIGTPAAGGPNEPQS